MSTVSRTASLLLASGATPTSAAPTGAVAVAINLPPGLANLTAGAIIKGVVISRDPKGQTLVKTANGTLTLTTTLALPPGSTLSLQVQTVGTQTQLIILSVNQNPLAQGIGNGALLEASGVGTTLANTASGGPGQSSVTVTTGPGILTATVTALPAATPGATTGAITNAVTAPEAGAAVPGNPASGGASAGAEAGANATSAAATAQPTATGPPASSGSAGSAGSASSATAAAPLVLGSRFAARIVALDPQGNQDPAAMLRAAAAGGGGARLVTGTVTAATAGGVQVETVLGRLTLSTAGGLPLSARIVLEILGPAQPPLPLPPLTELAGGLPLLALGRDWPALSEAVEALGRVDAELARNLVQTVIPRPGSGLAANMLFLLSALRGGDVRGWLGSAALRVLEKSGRHDLATRLGDDFTQISRHANNTTAGDWRAWLIPIRDGDTFHLVRFFVKRHPRRQPGTDERDEDTRFLVEVELDRLGALQLDGLIKRTRFDLILRSRRTLSPRMRGDIAAIFERARAPMGLAGNVTFQASANFPVNPLGETGTPAIGLSV